MNACQKRIEELVAEQLAAKETASTEREHAADEIRDSANPFARHTARLRAAMVSIVTEDDVQAIMRKMLAMAAAGSIPAMRLVMQYVVGKPTVAPNPDRVQLDEWNVHKETAAMTEDVPKVVQSLEPDACLGMARKVRPIMSELAMQKYAKVFAGTPEPTPSAPDGFDGDVPARSDRRVDDAAPPEDFDGGWVRETHQVADAEATPGSFDGEFAEMNV